MKRFITGFLVFVVLLSTYSQSNLISPERANSLSRMADFYSTAGNYDKAIELQKQSMDMTECLYGKGSFEYAYTAMNLSNYYYLKGRSSSLNSDKSTNNYYANAIKSLKIAIDVVCDSLLAGYDEMESGERYKLWQQVCPLFDRLLPCYVANNQNDSTISTLYNTILFTKGITWRNYQKAKEVDWKKIQKKLKIDDLAIEFISPVDLEEENISFYALVVDGKCNAPQMIKLFDIVQLKDSFKCAASQFDKDLKIGKLIWGTIEKKWPNIKNIYFSATHVLHNIPIESCPVDKNNYYSDKHNFYRLTSTAVLTTKNTRPQYKNAVLYGGLVYDSDSEVGNERSILQSRAGLESLENTGIEISEISHFLKEKGIKCKLYTGIFGTEASFRSLSGQSIELLHLSTHGSFLGDRDSSKYLIKDMALSQSYLAMSGVNKRLSDPSINIENDGIVTALDVSVMDLKKMDMVCLSACESALGTYSDDDAILGLQGGFKKAGANTILMSINKVDDEATKILMVEFYKNLMSGKTKHQSLKDAQKYLRQIDNGKYDKPKYWASFIMLDGLN